MAWITRSLNSARLGSPGQLVVVGLEGDGRLGLLALGDVARHPIGAEETATALGQVLVHAGGRDLDDHAGVFGLRRFNRCAPVEQQLEVAGGPLAGAPLVDVPARGLALRFHHQRLPRLAEQVGLALAGDRLDAVVDETDTPLGIKGVDDVGRVVDQEAMPLLRMRQALLDLPVFAGETELARSVAQALEQLLRLIGLAQEVIGPHAQGLQGHVQGSVAADDDHLGLLEAFGLAIEQVEAGAVGQVQVEQQEVEALRLQGRACLGEVLGRGHRVSVVPQQQTGALQVAGLVLDHQDAERVRVLSLHDACLNLLSCGEEACYPLSNTSREGAQGHSCRRVESK